MWAARAGKDVSVEILCEAGVILDTQDQVFLKNHFLCEICVIKIDPFYLISLETPLLFSV